jgi:hypothetical protein
MVLSTLSCHTIFPEADVQRKKLLRDRGEQRDAAINALLSSLDHVIGA